ncbi:MAG: hypothetical protein K2X09_02845, partial [Rickettsiales bacterium]|nr:hypothetical protein [Rickettsiales bacterium]
ELRFHRLALFASVGCSLFVLGWLVWLMGFGIDLADESFYLVWIATPFKYSISLSHFGYFYHPLYELIGGRIELLRQINLLATATLSFALANCLLKTIFAKALTTWERYVNAAALAIGAFIFLRLWLPTPSYNWLAFQALLVAAIGFVLAEREQTRASVIGWTLIGVGGWMAFMSKPSTALALAACVSIYLLAANKLRLRLLLIACVTAVLLLIVTAYYMDGSVIAFATRIQFGITYASMLTAEHSVKSVLRLDDYNLDALGHKLLYGGTALLAAVALAAASRSKPAHLTSAILVTGVSIIVVLIALGYLNSLTKGDGYHHLLPQLVLFAAIIVSVRLKPKGLLNLTRQQWSLAIIFLALPYVFAFGTANNYWWMQGLVSIFWVLGGITLLAPLVTHPRIGSVLIPFTMATQLIAVCCLVTGITLPYYQTQLLYKNNAKIRIGEHSTLKIAPTFATYITQMREAASHAGFEKNFPLIDLTGHSPGVGYVLDAQNTAQAWLIGNYPNFTTGSDMVAKGMLNNAPCDELARAWVLIEPNGPVPISLDVLHVFGATRASDYTTVARIKTVPGLGGFQPIQTQQLMKPTRTPDVARNACEKTRMNEK